MTIKDIILVLFSCNIKQGYKKRIFSYWRLEPVYISACMPCSLLRRHVQFFGCLSLPLNCREQYRFWRDFTDVQARLNFCCSHMLFFHDAGQICSNKKTIEERLQNWPHHSLFLSNFLIYNILWDNPTDDKLITRFLNFLRK